MEGIVAEMPHHPDKDQVSFALSIVLVKQGGRTSPGMPTPTGHGGRERAWWRGCQAH